jgi:SnoaL-like protein
MFMPNVDPTTTGSGTSVASRTVPDPSMSRCRRGSATSGNNASGGASMTRSTDVTQRRLLMKRTVAVARTRPPYDPRVRDGDDTADVVALWRLQSRYADVVTRRAWSELDELFRPDAVVHLDLVTAEPRDIVGPAALGEFIATSIERFDHFAFVILNTVVEVLATDAARGRIFMCELRHDRAADTWSTAHGCYQDSYVRAEGRWWFAERHYRSMARTGPEGVILGLPPETRTLG